MKIREIPHTAVAHPGHQQARGHEIMEIVAEETATAQQSKAWLVARTGPLSGSRYLLREGRTLLGRNAQNDIIVHGPNTA
ncbi:MAG TPA: hypothetical protein VMH81_25530, partial [Bryobacteraceae bacterium]|nr:hypothetical protein [Bryobacteraceae bacterium]